MNTTTATGTATGLTDIHDDDLSSMLLIRHFEQELLRLFAAGELNGTTHTCLGQEYIPVALGTLIQPDDHVLSNHRGHGHYLSRYDDPEGLLAEIMGRDGAICSGVGGSQHLRRERYLSSGIQGQSLPIAAGIAWHLKRATPAALALAFVGDGTWGEGAVYEALNLAGVWRVPLVVVVENNGIAQTTPAPAHLAGSIEARAGAFRVHYRRVTGTDVNIIRAGLRDAFERVRTERTPLVAEFFTERLGPHSKGDDVRSPGRIATARAHDWYPRYRHAFPHRFDALDAAARDRVGRAVEAVTARPAAAWRSA